jgi:hypothetical protein
MVKLPVFTRSPSTDSYDKQTSTPKHRVSQDFKKSDTIQAEYRIQIISVIFPAKCTFHKIKIISTKAHDQFLLHQEIVRQRLLHH